MEEREIVRLNIERYQRILQENLDESTRRTIETMLRELKESLPSPTMPGVEHC
jgi:hypothetical protein